MQMLDSHTPNAVRFFFTNYCKNITKRKNLRFLELKLVDLIVY